MINIFLVEDHALMRRTLTKLFEREKDMHICGTAESGREALSNMADANPDLLLIDISMPGMDGITLLEEVQSRWPDLPCMILSGHAEAIYGDQAREAGAIAFIDKRRVQEAMPMIRKMFAPKLAST